MNRPTRIMVYGLFLAVLSFFISPFGIGNPIGIVFIIGGLLIGFYGAVQQGD